MKRSQAVSGYQIARQSIALTLSVLLIHFASGSLVAQVPPQQPYPPQAAPPQPYPPQGQAPAPYPPQAPPYQPFDAVALDQMVAPIALYPDSLVAQILTAATYPQQVSDADNWSHQTAGLPPQQRADIANTMPWDPSVKALTAFPSVLDNLAQNYNWTASLGNAYYNQPGDVMNAVQAARAQAYQAGYLRPTPQQNVYYSGGLITIVPVNPAFVYVPYYNPWAIYGGWVRPYPGFYVAAAPPGLAVGLGIGFVAGVSIGLFAHYAWGFNSWSPNWRGGVVVYNNATYISRSVTVVNRGHFGEYNRGVFERPGLGVPANFHPAAVRAAGGYARGPAESRPAPGAFNRPAPAARPGGEYAGRPAPAARPEAVRPEAARPQVQRGEAQRAPAPAARGEAGANRPQEHAAPSRPAQGRPAQGRPAQEHGHEEEHK